MSLQNPPNIEPIDEVAENILTIADILNTRETCYAAISSLFDLASKCDEIRIECADAVPVIMGALKNRIGDYEFCRNGMATLRKIIGTDDGLLWRACAEAGGFHFFVNILKKYKGDIYVCKLACVGLAGMLEAPHPDLLTPNYPDVDRVSDAGGIEALVDTMNRYFNSEDICVAACTALGRIVELSGRCADKCVKAGLVPVFLDIIDYKSNCESLVERACYVLLHISNYKLLSDDECKDAISLVVQTIKKAYNPLLCLVLTKLVTDIVSQKAAYVTVARESGAYDIYISAQQTHMDESDVVACLGKALHSIADKSFAPHMHVLEKATHYGVCDICGSSAGDFMGCRECDYDECLLCNLA
jgi:hypothetical protein